MILSNFLCHFISKDARYSDCWKFYIFSFLDKTYVLSSPEAVEKFLKNPRPYLMPPQPRPPCKISVTGPHLSGKTEVAHLLAQKYGAKVLDIDVLIKPKFEEEKKKIVDQARKEATEQAIGTVKAKLKEEQEAAMLREESK
jgi:adenylate/nucleoside-diphosphate kinase